MKPEQTISLVVNGKPREISTGLSLSEFLASTGFKPTQVVVERNGEVVERARIEEVRLAAGDRLEVIIPVAGG